MFQYSRTNIWLDLVPRLTQTVLKWMNSRLRSRYPIIFGHFWVNNQTIIHVIRVTWHQSWTIISALSFLHLWPTGFDQTQYLHIICWFVLSSNNSYNWISNQSNNWFNSSCLRMLDFIIFKTLPRFTDIWSPLYLVSIDFSSLQLRRAKVAPSLVGCQTHRLLPLATGIFNFSVTSSVEYLSFLQTDTVGIWITTC